MKSVTNDLPSGFKISDIIEDEQIPASIEEVIAAVSTAKPTVPNIGKKVPKQKPNNSLKKVKFSQSVLLNFKKRKVMKQKRNKIERNVVKKEDVDVKPKSFPPPVVLPVSPCEEVIRIKKENLESDSDTEIDIDNEFETDIAIRIKEEQEEIDNKNIIKLELIQSEEIHSESKLETECEDLEMINNRLNNLDESVVRILTGTDIPNTECILESDRISEVERFIHVEFFEGRPTKTPDRYLTIRNYILEFWYKSRPVYCTKTSVRQGLKNCGDVNCIGRIHQYLEQIGAINFGCEQTCYKRPLINMYSNGPQRKEKSVSFKRQNDEVVRKRMKKKYNNDGEGGYTMMHDENGEIIDTTVVNEDKQNKPRNRRQNMKLVYCKNFSAENPLPFTVKLQISALILFDIHAHTAFTEVMGLLGGFFDLKSKTLTISKYVPCRSTDHSNTHCDMCPVSQSKASEILQNEGLDVIGWFHSHPTFYPNPSQQDIDTQLNMQLYMSTHSKPFVGVILSPFRSLANSFESEYRCLIVDNAQSATPYKFQIEHSYTEFDVDTLLKDADAVFSTKSNIPNEYVVDLRKRYLHNSSITYMDKLLASIKLHLARYGEINKMTCDAIMAGITEIFMK